MRVALTLLLVGGLTLATSGCARIHRAEDAGATKAHQLEAERVQKELHERDQLLQQILRDLKAEEQKLEAMQQRDAAGEVIPKEERVAAAKELARLREQLDAERKRHAELEREAASLGIRR
jgi:hypothetical protein